MDPAKKSDGDEPAAVPAPAAAPSIADLPPWDGHTWEAPDPNQKGSGWTEDDIYPRELQNAEARLWGIPSSHSGWDDKQFASLRAKEDPDHDTYLRLVYSDYIVEFERRRKAFQARERAGHSGSDSDGGYDSLPMDDQFPDYMESMQEYLEFILLVRDCAAKRAREGLPAAACSRHQPCDTCRLHDGSYLNVTYWQTLPDDNLDQHVREYLRIRDRLPPWRSARPAGVRPPDLVFGLSQLSLSGPTRPSLPPAPAAGDSTAIPGPVSTTSPGQPKDPSGRTSAVTTWAYSAMTGDAAGTAAPSLASPVSPAVGANAPSLASPASPAAGANARDEWRRELAMWQQMLAVCERLPETTRQMWDRNFTAVRNWPPGISAVDVRRVHPDFFGVDIRELQRDILRYNSLGETVGVPPVVIDDEDAGDDSGDDVDSLPPLTPVPDSSPSASEDEASGGV
ncbi:hypothetical protein AURDEDRAFT_128500 [Auricularia subglabra TFB-10046 SS5]|uniref:Uncharacterized protein n=1 Tax=Auricularia subglabra (strain TFB-10046 / SS5) TaxID=717982 RepID=J0WX35_AURST|nr:hypothetical protein AURDEDRAFT_128500 [Auricularia subglabra TFB-10046 SS5]